MRLSPFPKRESYQLQCILQTDAVMSVRSEVRFIANVMKKCYVTPRNACERNVVVSVLVL